jgi:flagellar basal body L-ring protein FlgH
MKAYRYMVYLMVMAALSACSHAEKEVDFTEDELSAPMVDQSENVQSPGSLWTPGAKYYDMFSDHKARRVGDLIIIQIVESSSADKELFRAADGPVVHIWLQDQARSPDKWILDIQR